MEKYLLPTVAKSDPHPEVVFEVQEQIRIERQRVRIGIQQLDSLKHQLAQEGMNNASFLDDAKVWFDDTTIRVFARILSASMTAFDRLE